MKPIARYDHTDKFEILNLIALFEFRTSSSISFLLATGSKNLEAANSAPIPVSDRVLLNKIGSVDVHHPCEGHIKAQFLFVLPEKYHKFETMRELVRVMLAKLQIPKDETYEARFISPGQQSSIEQTVDRDGMTDRL